MFWGRKFNSRSDFSEVLNLAAEINFKHGEIGQRNQPLDEVVPLGLDELPVVLADDGQQDAALLQKKQRLHETHRPAFRDPERSFRRHAPPQRVIQVHHDQLDGILLFQRPVHGEDFDHGEPRKIQSTAPNNAVGMEAGGFHPVQIVVMVAIAQRRPVRKRPHRVILHGLLPDAGGHLVGIHKISIFAPGRPPRPETY